MVDLGLQIFQAMDDDSDDDDDDSDDDDDDNDDDDDDDLAMICFSSSVFTVCRLIVQFELVARV